MQAAMTPQLAVNFGRIAIAYYHYVWAYFGLCIAMHHLCSVFCYAIIYATEYVNLNSLICSFSSSRRGFLQDIQAYYSLFIDSDPFKAISCDIE